MPTEDGQHTASRNRVSTRSFDRIIGPRLERSLTWRLKFGRVLFQPFSLDAFLRLMADNRWEVDSGYRGRVIGLAALSFWHSMFTVCERLLLARKLATVRLKSAPVFVLGHWRSGTTFLHNVLCQDPAFTYPKLYQVVFAGCFLLPGFKQLADHLERHMPATRPMDAIRVGMHEPWEEEFILTALTGISPYTRIWFPRRQGPGVAYRYRDLDSVQDRERWQREFIRLLKRLILLENKTLLLKSPPHMARIPLLLEMFPKAKFIHIVRHPYKVFVSSLKLWREAFTLGAVQQISDEEIVEMIFSTYRQVFARYENDKNLIPKGQLVEITYEDFVGDPYGSVESIYAQLGLGGIDHFAAKLQHYLFSLKRYRTNEYAIPEDIKREVRRRWSSTFDNYGYAD